MIRPGQNIAMKVPAHKWADTVAFYRDRVGLTVQKESGETVAFAFGKIVLWIDKVPHQSQTDIWLELLSDHPDEDLERLGSPRRDALEPLDGTEGHWTSDPAGTVLLLRKP